MEEKLSVGRHRVLGVFQGKMTREPNLSQEPYLRKRPDQVTDFTWSFSLHRDCCQLCESAVCLSLPQKLPLLFLRVNPGVSNLDPEEASWVLPQADPRGKEDNFIAGSQKPSLVSRDLPWQLLFLQKLFFFLAPNSLLSFLTHFSQPEAYSPSCFLKHMGILNQCSKIIYSLQNFHSLLIGVA